MGKTRTKQRHKQLKDKGGMGKTTHNRQTQREDKESNKNADKISISVTKTERERIAYQARI